MGAEQNIVERNAPRPAVAAVAHVFIKKQVVEFGAVAALDGHGAAWTDTDLHEAIRGGQGACQHAAEGARGIVRAFNGEARHAAGRHVQFHGQMIEVATYCRLTANGIQTFTFDAPFHETVLISKAVALSVH